MEKLEKMLDARFESTRKRELKLKGRVAVITGAGSGIGIITALLFAEEGANVVVVDINEKSGLETLGMLEESGAEKPNFLKANIAKEEEVQAMIKVAMNIYGRIDILVNNGGIVRDARIANMALKQWQDVIDVNLTGVFLCSKYASEIMVTQKKGVIINTSSVVRNGNFGQTNYFASKAGVVGLTKTLAKELGRKGVRVNAVAPGFIHTPMTEGVPEKVIELMKEKSSLGMIGDPLDVAYAYLYLASDEARFVTGTVLEVDGGLVV